MEGETNGAAGAAAIAEQSAQQQRAEQEREKNLGLTQPLPGQDDDGIMVGTQQLIAVQCLLCLEENNLRLDGIVWRCVWCGHDL